MTYPKTEKGTQTDDYFGTQIADPYRWLEEDTSAKTKAWVEEENKVTFSYLEKIPFRDAIKKHLTKLVDYSRYGTPQRAGEYLFFTKNNGLQNQPVIYYQKGNSGEPKVFIDPNKISADGTVSVNLGGFSHDKKYVAVVTGKSGSDWQEITVYDIATAMPLPDKLEWVKFSGAAWRGNGFYYSAYPKPVKGTEFSSRNEFHRVYFHKLGEAQEKDELVYEDRTHPLRYHGADVSDDERFLFIYASEGTDGTELLVRNLAKNEKSFRTLFPGFKYNYTVVDNIGDDLLVFTNNKAPNYCLLKTPYTGFNESKPEYVIPEKEELLEAVTSAGGHLFAGYLKDVTSRIYQSGLDGKNMKEIALPSLGTASGFGGEKGDKDVFFTFTGFTYPPSVFKYDIASGESTVFFKSNIAFNPDDYETKQVFYPSKDGTKVPMFLVYKKGLELNGNNPTLLYGYGGFNINLTPAFSAFNLELLNNGGIYALANLRGGGEYGEKWHKAGMLGNKQNVFDDFIAGAEYLVKEKYTSKDRLAVSGGSNGGLLVGACLTQRPDLFKVAFPAVGVLDMLRYHKFTVGWGWAVEYGSSDSASGFQNLVKYSPLHNLKEGVNYPATMVTTADHDDRVVPAHSFKFIATLQEKHKGPNPVLIRIDTKAGHGAGKSLAKVIDEKADVWAFMFYNMGITVKE
ncbi:MAG: prolyl oligopeptidase family serine peptidase [Bacteroidota bacterium]